MHTSLDRHLPRYSSMHRADGPERVDGSRPRMRPTPVARALKRTIDIAGAAGGLLVAAVPMGIVAIAIAVDMGRPIFFRHARPGRHGEAFTLIKFRTMHDGGGSDDERLSRLGRFLRSTSLDELPELWNVVRGDMSLVGPRPLLDDYLDRYDAVQARRHEVRPGLTGLAQVSGRNDLDWPQRLAADVRYVDTWTVTGDLAIIVRTIGSVLRRDGISADGHATMPEFHGTGSKQGALP